MNKRSGNKTPTRPDSSVRRGVGTRRLRVSAWNSTVNGRTAKADHDAREWFDGWKNLGVNNEKSYVDGHRNTNQPFGLFGGGRNKGFSCGEYLHAFVVGKGNDGRVYRVRCRFQPGGKYKGSTVKSVSLRKVKGIWHWILE